MGTLAHIVGDQRFDRYFMTRATRECDTTTYVNTWTAPTYSQVYTDQDLDWVLSPQRLSTLSGIASPVLPYVPWEVGHWAPLFVETSILEQAFPNKTAVSAPELALGVGAGYAYIVVEPALALSTALGIGPAEVFCS